MYTFDFHYCDGKNILIEHVKTVTALISGGYKDISEKDILTYKFPLSVELSLHSDDGNFTVSRTDLRALKITKEN